MIQTKLIVKTTTEKETPNKPFIIAIKFARSRDSSICPSLSKKKKLNYEAQKKGGFLN